MAEITFKITDGPYEGDYAIDIEDFTATELGLFRKAVGFPLESIAENGVGIDVLAGLVWLTQRRRPKQKGLPFEAVADTIRTKNLEVVSEEEVNDPPA